ncbi:hypothetical protein TWF696_002116 [Orbilia brochopaga]|uniref:HNH nuclease domain-containing protein n=1 Tax=Orbilia brochopaga TaxID=3140254 RepID=A0AAV9U6T9_9PEZI
MVDFAHRMMVSKVIVHTSVSTQPVPDWTFRVGDFFCDKNIPITRQRIFEDMKILYPELKVPPTSYKLSLWTDNTAGIATFTHEGDRGVDRAFPMSIEWLEICFHDDTNPQCPLGKGSGITEHVKVGCAIIPNLEFDPDANGYMPIDTTYGIPTAHLSRPTTPTNHQRSFNTSSPDSWSSPPQPAEVDPYTRAFVESLEQDTRSFERGVKSLHTHCLITQTNSRFANLDCGPGYTATHIVPQQLWFSYPDRLDQRIHDYPINVVPSSDSCDESTLRSRMAKTWRLANGILLRADIHEIFNQRLLAIHPVTDEMRIFAPMDVVAGYHGKKVIWEARPDRTAIAYHYQQCVLENVGAMFTPYTEIAVTRKWREKVNAVARTVPEVIETIDHCQDGIMDKDDARSLTKQQEIEGWLQKFNAE